MNASASLSANCSPVARARLSFLDRYLTVWIFAAMALGVALGRFVPSFGEGLTRLSVGWSSIPIAVGLIVMMAPPLGKVKYAALGIVFSDSRVFGLSLIQHWMMWPVLMWVPAVVFLRSSPD